MKKFFAVLMLAAALILPGLAQAKDAQTSMIDDVVKRGVLRVGFSSFVPWAMQDKNGEFVGFEIDVAKRLAKDLGVELQLVPTKWAGIIPALMAGKFDVIIGSMSVTPERNLKANFTVPYDYATIEVMANKEKTKGMKFPEDFNKPEVVVALRDKLDQPSTDAFSRQPVGMVIRKGDPDSLNVLDNWIRTVEAEGWLPERRHFWFKTTDWEAQLR